MFDQLNPITPVLLPGIDVVDPSNNSEDWKVTPLIAMLAGQLTRGQNDFFTITKLDTDTKSTDKECEIFI